VHGYVEGGVVGLDSTGFGSVGLACAPDSEAACYRGAGRAVLARLKAEVACPVTVLVGGDSSHLDRPGRTTREHFAAVATAFRSGALVEVAGGGHFHPQERPQAVADAVEAAARAALTEAACAAAPARPRLREH